MNQEAAARPREATSTQRANRVLVVGIGNDYRRDDAAGLEIARRIRDADLDGVAVQEGEGDIATLIESWSGFGMVILVDTVKSSTSPGQIFRFDAHQEPIPQIFVPHLSSHGFGVTEAIGLAETLDRMPPRLIVYGVEGSVFDNGISLSPLVETALPEAVARIAADIREYAPAE